MPEGVPAMARPTYDDNSTPTIVNTEVATGAIQWQANLAALPLALALDRSSQIVIKGMIRPPQLAVALHNQDVVVLNLNDGSILKTFSSRYGKSTIRTSSMAFGDGPGKPLWTVGTRYTADAENRTVTSVSAWDVVRGKRVATAEVRGQIVSSGWNAWGTQLATIRHIDTTALSQKRLPWSFHLWDIKIGRTK